MIFSPAERKEKRERSTSEREREKKKVKSNQTQKKNITSPFFALNKLKALIYRPFHREE
jgi:hypothetical protein